MNVNTVINIAILLLIVWFLYTRLKPVNGLTHLKANEFRQAIKSNNPGMVVDVREPAEYNRGFIPGAVNIPLSQLQQRLSEIPQNKQVFLYCQSGMRSKSAAKILSKHGYDQISNLKGGVSAWRDKLASKK
ncbi:rhodanese-like domain-containing protein [Paenibacillus barcinonensis]|uniref:Rhodanese-like domain-containing protein n=1 Tax=Paenibacillus barcinonensis TaxID=198119 RepID=A0A2V4UZB1_PAEBA|nr:rhodanese-like domain-containing protein [Paenibacillus barcinonensis]PYE45433.1 rhodanese-related sulfurtransferase [Paenibacillus barcinonensis]QKS55249.1 rhodanese-like domain-containing protein [Paenibacillus barcinonensis]